jgi:hypothetical protein
VPSKSSEAVLFLSSFSPLLVVFGLLESFGAGWPSIVCFAIAGASLVFLFLALSTWRTLGASRVTVARARHRDADVIGYVATYVVPFAALGVESWRQKVALLGFLVLVGVLYIRAHLFYVNPILSAIGYRLFEVETSGGRVMLVISRRKYIQVNTQIDLRTLSDYIFLDARDSAASTNADDGDERAARGR